MWVDTQFYDIFFLLLNFCSLIASNILNNDFIVVVAKFRDLYQQFNSNSNFPPFKQ